MPITALKHVLIGVCEDPSTGKLRFVKETWKFIDGKLVGVCHKGGNNDGCFDPPACTNECDTGSGGGSSGGGGSTHDCPCLCNGMPDQLTATIFGGTIWGCPCFPDGTITVQLDWVDSTKHMGVPGWEGTGTMCSDTYHVEITCDAQNGCVIVTECVDMGLILQDWFFAADADCNNQKITGQAVCCDPNRYGALTIEISW